MLWLNMQLNFVRWGLTQKTFSFCMVGSDRNISSRLD